MTSTKITQLAPPLLLDQVAEAVDLNQVLWSQDALGLVTWMWDTRANEVRWFGDIAPLLGLAAGTFSGLFEDYLGYVHTEDREASRRVAIECLKGLRRNYHVEERVVWADGSIHWLETYVHAESGATGEALRVMGVVKDITARKTTELALAVSEDRLSQVFNASPIAIVVTQLSDGRVLNVNPHFERLTGFSAAEVIGRTLQQLNLYPDTPGYQRWLTELSTHGFVRDFPMRGRTKDGQTISLRTSSARAQFDGQVGVISLARDVTAEEAIERKIAESERKYAAVFDTSPEAIAITRRNDDIFIEVNVAFVQQFGRTREQTLGRSAAELGIWFNPADRTRAVALLDRDGRLSNFETQCVHVDLTARDVLVSAALLEVADEKCIAWAWRDVTEIRHAERARAQSERLHREELTRIANQDPLTRLPNRAWVMEHLDLLVANARESGAQFAVLFIDFDGFKKINDTIGHAVGDELLKAAALRLQKTLRTEDHVARIGGDEFTVLMSPISGVAEVERLARRLADVFRSPFALSNHEVSIGISVGVAMFPADGDSGDALLRSADIAMYEVKAQGRGSFHFYTADLFERLRVRADTEKALAGALVHDELVLHYQPRVRGTDGRLVGFEALLRWRHAERGLLSPAHFIPLAQESGLMVKIGERVIELVCEQIASWRMQRVPLVPVSVNLTAQEFQRPGLCKFISGMLTRHSISPDLLQIEISESSTVNEHFNVDQRLAEISGLGLKILIDDFGSGYSSLSQLQTLDVDVLKIDPAFVRKLGTTPQSEVFVHTIINMANALNMTAVAEGVETLAQLETLQRLKCDQVQGFLLSRPVEAQDVPELLARSSLLPAQS